MKWAIIVLIMLSLIGSMMWVMPSPRQRFQSKLRLDARKQGFHVSLARLKLPRAQGEMEGDERNMPLYRYRRDNLDRKERDSFVGWSVARVNALANTGLPPGWSWINGESTLDNSRLTALSNWLEGLPLAVEAVESDSMHLALYWSESELPGSLEALAKSAAVAVEQKL